MHLVILSNKPYNGDFRKYLALAAEAAGVPSVHVSIRSDIRLSWRGVEQVCMPLDTPIPAISEIIRRVAGGGDGITLTGMNGFKSLIARTFKAHLQPSVFYYDIYDDFRYGATGTKRLRRMRDDLIWRAHCDRQLILEHGLSQRYPKAYHLDNASHVTPDAPASKTKNRAIYIGSIDERTNFHFLEQVAATGMGLDIYGRVHCSFPHAERLIDALCAREPAVSYHGGYDNSQLGEVLTGHAIGLVPYHTNSALTRHINPDKIYHYLNAGLQVVATSIPQTRRMVQHLHLVDEQNTLESVLSRISTQPRKTFWDITKNTWDARWIELQKYHTSFASRHNR